MKITKDGSAIVTWILPSLFCANHCGPVWGHPVCGRLIFVKVNATDLNSSVFYFKFEHGLWRSLCRMCNTDRRFKNNWEFMEQRKLLIVTPRPSTIGAKYVDVVYNHLGHVWNLLTHRSFWLINITKYICTVCRDYLQLLLISPLVCSFSD